MDPREVPIYLLLPGHHQGLGDIDLLDLVASRFTTDVWRDRITAQGALEVAFEHARWLVTQHEAPLSIPVSASTTRIISFTHGVLSITLTQLLGWFADHGCVEASELESIPADPPATPPDWTPNEARRPEPEDDEPQKHWLFDAEDPYAVPEAMGDTPERPVLTIGVNDSEEPHEYVVSRSDTPSTAAPAWTSSRGAVSGGRSSSGPKRDRGSAERARICPHDERVAPGGTHACSSRGRTAAPWWSAPMIGSPMWRRASWQAAFRRRRRLAEDLTPGLMACATRSRASPPSAPHAPTPYAVLVNSNVPGANGPSSQKTTSFSTTNPTNATR